MTSSEIAGIFDAKPVGSGFMGLCPAHDDHTPSLSITDGRDGRVLVKCFAGCTFEQIVAASGLNTSEFMPPAQPTKTKGASRIVATYPYTDKDGKLVFEVVRYEPKDFRQRRPDGHGGSVWNMSGVTRVLYRLPDVLKAKASGETIFVTEGEKDAEAIVKLGLCATTNAGGAVKWEPQYTEALTGAKVVVLPDKDEAGRRHMALVLHELGGKAESVKVVELPDRNQMHVKDAADWAVAGGTREELEDLAGAAPLFTQAGNPSDGLSEAMQPIADVIVPLPSDDTPISDSARIIFDLLSRRLDTFYRGGRVVEVVKADGTVAIDVLMPDAFRSRIEKLGIVGAWGKEKGSPVFRPRRAGKDGANALLATTEARELLPPIELVASAPVLVLDGGKTVRLGQGYHREGGGIYIFARWCADEVMPLEEAAGLIEDLLCDFSFATPADKARALVAILTPALVLGGFITGHSPLIVGEADQSQSGKDYLCTSISSIFGETASLVAQRTGGVGGLDESLQERLILGRPFIHFSNLRGTFDSPFFEAALTSEGMIGCRVPHRGEVHISPRKFIFMATSNGFKGTVDLANRSLIIRLRKQPSDYRFKNWTEGDLLAHIRANNGRYLSAIFSIIEHWHRAGCVRTWTGAHDFRDWSGSVTTIMQNAWPKAGLWYEGHRAAQTRTANPALSWLREVALALCETGRCGEEYSATSLAQFCEERGIDVPGLRDPTDESKACRAVGRLMTQCLAGKSEVAVESVTVQVIESSYLRPDGNGSRPCRRYFFSLSSTIPPNPLNPRNELETPRENRINHESAETLRGLGGIEGLPMDFEKLKFALADYGVGFACNSDSLEPTSSKKLPPELIAAIRYHEDALRAWIGLQQTPVKAGSP